MNVDFTPVTEIPGVKVSREQIERLFCRYYWATKHCKGKDVVEVACGAGQGLGLLSKYAKSLIAGDCCEPLLNIAKATYGDRVHLEKFDAENIPLKEASVDVVILFEAIYYLSPVERFLEECKRILRPNGTVLIATANKDIYDFNSSKYSQRYYGIVELKDVFEHNGFAVSCYGNTLISNVSLRQKIFLPLKKIAVVFNLIPKNMSGKQLLKRIVFGKLVEMPKEITGETAIYQEPELLQMTEPNRDYKVLFCLATKHDRSHKPLNKKAD